MTIAVDLGVVMTTATMTAPRTVTTIDVAATGAVTIMAIAAVSIVTPLDATIVIRGMTAVRNVAMIVTVMQDTTKRAADTTVATLERTDTLAGKCHANVSSDQHPRGSLKLIGALILGVVTRLTSLLNLCLNTLLQAFNQLAWNELAPFGESARALARLICQISFIQIA